MMTKSKLCVLTNGQFSWMLQVDGQTIDFDGYYNAEYFRDHYGDLGYTVIIEDGSRYPIQPYKPKTEIEFVKVNEQGE